MAEPKVATMFTAPGIVDFGAGAVNGAGQRAKELGAGRAFVVTDKGVRNAGLLARLTSALEAAGVASEVWDAVRPNPTDKDVTAGVEAFRKANGQLILGLGGGSPLDAAKGVALMATHEGRIQDYDAAVRGWEKVKPTIPPLLAIPTTAGTGSEMSAAAIITDTSRNVKMIVASPFLKPRLAMLDPELTLAMPPSLTAATGMDALTHAIEAYVALDYHPFGDALALGAIELIGQSLRKAFAEGQNLAARTDMLLASAMAGAAMNYKGLGACHALAHQLTPEAGIPHGVANAILLPHVMRFNLTVATDKFARLAAALGADTHGRPSADAAALAVEAVTRLSADLGLPATLAQANAKRESIERLAQNALHDRCRKNNPRPCVKADLIELLGRAF